MGQEQAWAVSDIAGSHSPSVTPLQHPQFSLASHGRMWSKLSFLSVMMSSFYSQLVEGVYIPRVRLSWSGWNLGESGYFYPSLVWSSSHWCPDPELWDLFGRYTFFLHPSWSLSLSAQVLDVMGWWSLFLSEGLAWTAVPEVQLSIDFPVSAYSFFSSPLLCSSPAFSLPFFCLPLAVFFSWHVIPCCLFMW